MEVCFKKKEKGSGRGSNNYQGGWNNPKTTFKYVSNRIFPKLGAISHY